MKDNDYYRRFTALILLFCILMTSLLSALVNPPKAKASSIVVPVVQDGVEALLALLGLASGYTKEEIVTDQNNGVKIVMKNGVMTYETYDTGTHNGYKLTDSYLMLVNEQIAMNTELGQKLQQALTGAYKLKYSDVRDLHVKISNTKKTVWNDLYSIYKYSNWSSEMISAFQTEKNYIMTYNTLTSRYGIMMSELPLYNKYIFYSSYDSRNGNYLYTDGTTTMFIYVNGVWEKYYTRNNETVIATNPYQGFTCLYNNYTFPFSQYYFKYALADNSFPYTLDVAGVSDETATKPRTREKLNTDDTIPIGQTITNIDTLVNEVDKADPETVVRDKLGTIVDVTDDVSNPSLPWLPDITSLLDKIISFLQKILQALLQFTILGTILDLIQLIYNLLSGRADVGTLIQSILDFLSNILSGILGIPLSIAYLFDNIVTAITGIPNPFEKMFIKLFKPSDNLFDSLVDKIKSKFPIVDQLKDLITSFLNIQHGEMTLFQFTYRGVTCDIVNFTPFKNFVVLIQGIVVSIAYYKFARRLYYKLPAILGGFYGL